MASKAAETKINPSPVDPLDPSAAVVNGSTGNDAEFAKLLAHIERRKNNRQYFETWDEQAAEYRQQQEPVND